MKLLIARHGECEANVRGVVAGARDDSPLTEKGWQDAQLLADNLVGFRGNIVASPLKRALNTAELVRDQMLPGAPIRVDEDFIEADVGDATGLPIDEYFVLEKSGESIPNAETPEQLFARVKHGLETIKATGQTTLIIAHNGTCRMITCVLEGLAPHEFANVKHLKNGEVRTFEL